MSDQDDINHAARRAVQDNARHSAETLWALLDRWFPDATNEQLNEAVEHGLYGEIA